MFSWQGKVSRDSFTYDGSSFYVEVDQHRHPRASPTSLHALLTYVDPAPLLTKKGTVAKRQPKSHPDPPAHYYQAQCIHHGLHAYKQRPAAKKHLLAAFESGKGTIIVPERVQALEKEMMAEYEAAHAVAQQQMEEAWAAEEKRYAAARREWEDEFEAERIRQSEEVGRMVQDFAAAGIRIQLGRINGSDSDNEAAPTRAAKNAKLRNDIAETQLRAIVEKLVFEKKARLMKKAMSREVNALGNVAEAAAKVQAKTNKNNLKRLADLPTKDDEGTYKIVAPYVLEGWGDPTRIMTFEMTASHGNSHFWVSFQFGVISGVMRSYGAPPVYIGDKVRFHWRGRDDGTGETTYDRQNTASIIFLGKEESAGA
ncbi:hypothetical protein H0H81_005589 [Sphagnurus paluster]|uniref:Uncharacterized protein n=1 Tax=Sphagnurus paluster TaxID=117069 RepID=A0A9P7GKG4_9AGAR|nr:hypothetical protein H0H81_005589 [Sphagnurus paluster]